MKVSAFNFVFFEKSYSFALLCDVQAGKCPCECFCILCGPCFVVTMVPRYFTQPMLTARLLSWAFVASRACFINFGRQDSQSHSHGKDCVGYAP